MLITPILRSFFSSRKSAVVAVRPRRRWLLTVLAPAALAFVALYIMFNQYRHHWVSDLAWPARYTRLSQLAWLAILLLAADAVVEIVRTRSRRE